MKENINNLKSACERNRGKFFQDSPSGNGAVDVSCKCNNNPFDNHNVTVWPTDQDNQASGAAQYLSNGFLFGCNTLSKDAMNFNAAYNNVMTQSNLAKADAILKSLAPPPPRKVHKQPGRGTARKIGLAPLGNPVK